MNEAIHSLMLSTERDVVNARQRARSIADALGFDHHDQIRIATSVSEIARNAFRYAKGGSVSFAVDPEGRMLRIAVTDQGGGIPHLDTVLGGSYQSSTGLGMGILGTQRLMDEFSIQSNSQGTSVQFGKSLPIHIAQISKGELERVQAELKRQHPATPIWNARLFLYQLRSDKTGTRGAVYGAREEAYGGADRESAAAG
jgi:anti-sigma regulatory factor (Ser/Thr protein kinase)